MNFNKAILVGNLTRDPEIRYIGSGAAVTKFTLAINRKTKNNEENEFIDIVSWDKLAETCNTYLKKGQGALVEGRIKIRSYDDKEGVKRKAFEIVAQTVQFGSSKDGSQRTATAAGVSNGGDFDEAALEDEIPF